MSTPPDSVRGQITGPRGLRRLIAATGYSLSGLASGWRSEEAFRIEVMIAVVLLPMALWLGRTPAE